MGQLCIFLGQPNTVLAARAQVAQSGGGVWMRQPMLRFGRAAGGQVGLARIAVSETEVPIFLVHLVHSG